jgi:predicted Zn-dependent peptidase
MDQEKLDKQRDVVRNERRQSYENRPYGKAELAIQEMMYPPGHPYHIPVIGTHEDLEAATVSDVKDFFAAFYVPANVTLSVAGDFDPKTIKPLIADLFGGLPLGGTPQRRTAGPAKLDSVKRATMPDKVQLPLIAMVYHSPAWYAEGDAEMNLAAAVLSRGKTSRLYKRLVYDDKIAAEVSAYQDASQLGSLFRIDVLANPGVDLDRVEKAIDEEVVRLTKEGPTAKELEKYKVGYELSMLNGLQSVEAKADQLNEYDYIWGEPNSFKRDLERFRSSTVEGLRQWCGKVFTQDARLIMRVLPEGPERTEPPVDKKTERTAAHATEPPSQAPPKAPERKASPRDQQPKLASAAAFDPPMPESFKLKNGIPVMLWTKKDLPLVAMTVAFLRDGFVIGDTDRAGAIWMTADMLDEGTIDLNALEFNDAMQQLGARFTTSAERDAILLSLNALQRNFDRAAELAIDSFRRNRLDYNDFDRVRKLHLEELRQHEDEPGIVASRVAASAFYGRAHRYGWPMEGTLDTIAKMTHEELKIQYATIVRPQNATVMVAGDIDRGDLQPLLESLLGSWNLPALSNSEKQSIKTPQRDHLEVLMVDRPDAVQTVIQFIMPGPTYGDARRTQYWLLNTLLGGSFTSRLNMNLREEHGFTYGARSAFNMRKDTGHLVATSSVRADATGDAVAEFLREFGRLSGGDVTDEDTGKARETLRTDVIQSFAGLNGIIRQAFERSVNKQPMETLHSDMKSMQAAGTSQLNELARTAVPLDKGVLVLVGDKKTILKELAELQPVGPAEAGSAKIVIPAPVEVDSLGNRIGS